MPRCAAWLGLASTLLLTGLWLSSYHVQLGLRLTNSNSTYLLSSGAGSVQLERFQISGATATRWRLGASADRHSAQAASWLPRLDRAPLTPGANRMSSLGVLIPYWLPLLFLVGPTAYLFGHRRRAARLARANACPHCAYSLKGLAPNSPCPECGKLSHS